MKIAYLCNWSAGGNCDEHAIAHALTALGHDVNIHPEHRTRSGLGIRGDIALFHKFPDPAVIAQLPMPRVCWYFDLADWPGDESIRLRCEGRKSWWRQMLPGIDVAFCTDGDHVAADTSGKLVWLTQGADERLVGRGVLRSSTTPILFTGIARHGGRDRESFVTEMKQRYGSSFRHVSSGVHGKELADMIAGASIVVAPDSPVTDRYWSNRVWLSLGFGAFMLHPWCARLAEMYEHDLEIVFYHGRRDLHKLIEYYLAHPAERARVAAAGLERTKREHLYRHRCERLVSVVRRRLFNEASVGSVE